MLLPPRVPRFPFALAFILSLSNSAILDTSPFSVRARYALAYNTPLHFGDSLKN
jgi:hypothetical protein